MADSNAAAAFDPDAFMAKRKPSTPGGAPQPPATSQPRHLWQTNPDGSKIDLGPIPKEYQTADEYSPVPPKPFDPDAFMAQRGGGPPSLVPGTPNSNPTGRFVSGFANAVNPVPGIKAIATDPQGLKHGIEHNLYQPQADQFTKAGEAIQGTGEFKGMSPLERASETFGHGAAGLIPLVGPAAANAGDQIGSGDVAGGIGSGLGLLTSAAIPAMGRGTGAGLRRVAEPLAESSLGIRNIDRTPGKMPGRAALDMTKGYSPSAVRASAATKIGDLATQRDAALSASPNKVSLIPARDEVEGAITKAAAGNSETSHLIPMREQLNDPRAGFAGNTYTAPSGTLKISDLQDPMNALAIRQRFGSDFTKFDHARPLSNETLAVGNRAYGALTRDIHGAVPESAVLDKNISNLIPVRDSAGAKDLNAKLPGQIMGRIGAKTGALATTLGGAAAGNMAAGIPGAIIGGAAGVALPEIMANPSVQMFGARSLNRAGNVIRSPFANIPAGVAPFIKRNDQ